MSARIGLYRLVAALAIVSVTSAADWIAGEGFRSREVSVPPSARPQLTEIPATQTGINFHSDVDEQRGVENSIRLAGTGVAAGDVDGDGWTDLFFCSMGGKSVLYRNLGNWKFEDITASAGVAFEGQDSTGAALADIDGDGDLDLLINSIGGGTRLFLNDGKGHFTESLNSGLLRRNGSISMTLADVDGNGTLDLYVVNYAKTKIEDRPTTRISTARVNNRLAVTALDGIPTTSPELTNRYYIDASNTIRELGEADTLYLNDGHGKFTPVSWTGGAFIKNDGAPLTLPPYDWGLSAMFRDMNGDGAPDLYVCNDLFTPDRIWINDGKGSFHELPAFAMRESSLFSMGVDFADINRDGFDDFIVVDMLSKSLSERKVQIVGVQPPRFTIGKFDDRPQYKRNTLFLNRGDNTYAEIGQLAGIEATGWSWSPVFIDIDLDGYEDLLVTAGYYRDALNADAVMQMKSVRANAKRALTKEEYRELKKLFPPLPQQNKAFRNRGNLTFEDKSADWGFADNGISQAICLADLDNDGDLDVIVVRQNGPVAVYKNEASAPRVAVRLKGKSPNTRGVGAKIKLAGASISQSQEMISGGRYLCADDPIRAFAVPWEASNLSLEVTWRSGARSIVRGVVANRIYEIDESVASDKRNDQAPAASSIFENVSQLLDHTHFQQEFDDFQRQPSLTQKLSQSGPGVSWFDLDGDGRDDLIIGCAKGGTISVFRNTTNGFVNISSNLFPSVSVSTGSAIVLNLDKTHVIVAYNNYEDSQFSSKVDLVDIVSHTSIQIASIADTIGAMALADYNADGELDLFIGGRVLPGRYPDTPASYLYYGVGPTFRIDRKNSHVVSRAGLVTGAVWSDLNGDGFPELIVSCEWGPIRIFKNDHGSLADATKEFGMAGWSGLWNGVTVGDFDGDGRMDIVASNQGRNCKLQSFRSKPPRIYYGHLPPPSADTVSFLCSFDERDQKWLPHCDFLTAQRALPPVTGRFTSFKAYASASIDDIFSGQIFDAAFLEANLLESTVFLNRGDHFEPRPLPAEAQFAPAFGVSVADFDGDGVLDIFIAQNFFDVDGSTGRFDGGRGLLLKGNGDGSFNALTGDESGIKLYGEQRASAVADFDGDGRVDLIVTQNGSQTALFRNKKSPLGLRVRLEGPPGNPRAIGATVRIKTETGFSPASEVHAGSGCLSGDSSVLILHCAKPAQGIWVRWPDGSVETHDIPPNTSTLNIRHK